MYPVMLGSSVAMSKGQGSFQKGCDQGLLGQEAVQCWLAEWQGKNFWRIYTRSRKPRFCLRDDSAVAMVGPVRESF